MKRIIWQDQMMKIRNLAKVMFLSLGKNSEIELSRHFKNKSKTNDRILLVMLSIET